MKALNAAVSVVILLLGMGAAAAQNAPQTSTKKVDGTDNVYVFRYGGHQSMFVVTSQGVIATDPISYLRPAKPYIDAIKAVTDKPIKYVIYSHHHYDHIAGGQPFKDLGATFVAHRRVKERLLELKKQNALLADVVMPDQLVDDKKTIKLGDTTLELIYVGRNHSDNSLVMRLPKEKIVFVVDFAPIETVQFRNIPDNASPLEYIASLKKLAALDWERMIPGHPYAGGRYGTKKDVEDDIAYMEDLSTEVKKAADAGKCFDTAMKEVKLPKYEKWANYEASLPANVERFCYWWARGY
ncbi:MBL fold metallo-hydrolase [Bradyrhizobium sp. HKCCYLS1011]|uniref:MBL fold metallo-hydrolase n=1 Tax=Bradyrhizobium sp. HKCCYLS1011 TaxID=3420733 RepID=UPI003EBBFE48